MGQRKGLQPHAPGGPIVGGLGGKRRRTIVLTDAADSFALTR